MINMELLLIVQEQMSQFMGRGEILSYRRMMRIDAYDRLALSRYKKPDSGGF